MPVLGVSQKPVVMPSYPHMMSQDIAVWSKYLRDPLVPIKEVWYDVHVGKQVAGILPGDIIGGKIAAGITRKRIDVVAHVGGGYWVVEVKPVASMVALGQVLSYQRLFVDEYVLDGEAWPVVVCDSVDEDLLDGFDAAGVAVVVNE